MDRTRLRNHVWHILNDPDDVRHTVFVVFINFLIIVSVGILVYETFSTHTNPLSRSRLVFLDRIILSVFLVEYAARLWVIRHWYPTTVHLTPWQRFKYFLRSRLRFILSPWGLIDFLALLPLVPFLRSLRALRLLRLFRSMRISKGYSPILTLMSAFRTNALLFIVAGFVVVFNIVLGAVLFFFAEYGNNANVNNLGDTLWWAIVTISTVGFGDITPMTPGGRVIGAALMISGMFVIAIFAGVTSSTLVGHLLPLQTEHVRMSALSDHYVIAGWNDNVPMLLRQLEAESPPDMPPHVVVFAPLPRPESLAPRFMFIQGDFTKEAEYDKVRLKFAKSLIVISDTSRQEPTLSARDASVVLTIFTARRLERSFLAERTLPVHICAEILDPENVEHARVAGADEVLATALVGNSLLAHTASNPGVGSILNDLLLATENNIYTTPMPPGLIDGDLQTFQHLQAKIRKSHDVMLLGVIHDGQLRLNPDDDHPVFLGDRIIYIGHKRLDTAP